MRKTSREPDVHLAFDEHPLLRCAHHPHEVLEKICVVRRVLEPSEKVEGLAEIAGVIQPWAIAGAYLIESAMW